MTEKEKDILRQKIEDGSIYEDRRYAAWRKRIFKRDGYQCQFHNCKYKYGTLNAHHIKMKWYFPELIYKALNGITLCKYHHEYVHKRGSDKYIEKFEEIAKENGKKKRIIRQRKVKKKGSKKGKRGRTKKKS